MEILYDLGVKVLQDFIVPLELHRKTPRDKMGDTAWEKITKKVQDAAKNHCMCCKRFVPHVKPDLIETHEVYEYDFKNKTQDIKGVVGLCKECHLYVHQGHLFSNLKIYGRKKADEVIAKGDKLIEEAGLPKIDKTKAANVAGWKQIWDTDPMYDRVVNLTIKPIKERLVKEFDSRGIKDIATWCFVIREFSRWGIDKDKPYSANNIHQFIKNNDNVPDMHIINIVRAKYHPESREIIAKGLGMEKIELCLLANAINHTSARELAVNDKNFLNQIQKNLGKDYKTIQEYYDTLIK